LNKKSSGHIPSRRIMTQESEFNQTTTGGFSAMGPLFHGGPNISDGVGPSSATSKHQLSPPGTASSNINRIGNASGSGTVGSR
jgi:hypothetical protein